MKSAVLKLYDDHNKRFVDTINYPEAAINECLARWKEGWVREPDGIARGNLTIEHMGLQLIWLYKPIPAARAVCGAVVTGFNPPGNKAAFSPQITVSVYAGVDRRTEKMYLGDDVLLTEERPLLIITYNEPLIRANAVRHVHDGNNRLGPTDDSMTLGIVESASLGIVAAHQIIEDFKKRA